MATSPSLMERLTNELECSVCLNIYTDPKTLPCLHTFCRHCLNQLAERRVNQEPIACPDCRTEIDLPEGSNFDTFRSSFYLNRLLDVVSAQDAGHHVLCNSCDKKSTATAFCFNCECFICDECRELHSRIKMWKGHRMTAFPEAQDAVVQQILGRPQLCEEPYHTTEILEFFCKPCQRCICQKCAIMTHKNHEFVHVDEAAHQAKLRLNESKKKVQDGVCTCEEQQRKVQEARRELEEQIVAAERSVQHATQSFIELAKQHERKVMIKLATIRENQGQELQGRKEILELRVGQLSSVTDYLDGSVFERGISVEILRAEPSVSNRSEELLKSLGELQPVKSERVKYASNEDVYHNVEQFTLGGVVVGLTDPKKTQIKELEKKPICVSQCAQYTVVTRDTEGNVCYSVSDGVTVQIQSPAGDDVEKEIEDRRDGRYSVCFTPKTEGVHHVTVKVQGQSPANCPVDVNVTRRVPHSYKHLSSFGSKGSRNGQFQYPIDVSGCSTGKLAVSDSGNHRVQFFSSNGQFLKKFVTPFSFTSGVGYNKYGDRIIVGDYNNARMHVFSPTGRLITRFGGKVLKKPFGVSVTNDDNVVVCDNTTKKVFVFSSGGKLLLQFASCLQNQASTVEHYAIFHGGKYFVSAVRQMVRVFDSRGAHLYDIGTGQLDTPAGLAVDANDLLLVCDKSKHCVKVFTLDGNFVTSFGSIGSGKGELNTPCGITVIPDGRVFICDFNNHRIQVFEPEY